MLLAAINWHSAFFLLYAIIACGFAAAVLFTSNVVRMAFYLTLSLGATSALFFLAGAEFVGAMQLMIYVGGTLVLLIFGVMLTAQAKFVSMQTSSAEWILAAIVGCSLLALLVRGAIQVPSWTEGLQDQNAIAMADSKTSTPIGLALSGVRVDELNQPNESLRKGMSGYLLPFVIISMHLLVVLIGAGYMARTKTRKSAAAVPAQAPVRPNRKHSFAVMGGLVTGGLVNAALAIKAFYFASGGKAWSPVDNAQLKAVVEYMNQWMASLPEWLMPLLGVLFAINALLMLVVYGWQKWGVTGVVIVPLLIGLCLFNAGQALAAAILTVALLVPAGALVFLITTGSRSEWSQMD